MTEPAADPAAVIQASFGRAVRAGMRVDAVTGATDVDIDAMAAAQRVRSVPAAVREVLRLIGKQHAFWLAGSSLGVHLGDDAKRRALARLAASSGDSPIDPEGALVLVEHGGYAYHLVDGADLELPDPPVWLVSEGDDVAKAWATVTVWFEGTTPDIELYREELKILRETGDDWRPAWAQYIELK